MPPVNRAGKTKPKTIDELVDQATSNHERIIVRRGKRAVAAVVPIEDLEVLEAIEDRMDIEEAKARLNESAVPWSQVKKELGL